MRSLAFTRNLCAHHSRIWNRRFTDSPRANKAYDICKHPNFGLRMFFSQAVIIKILLDIVIPTNHWENDLKDLLRNFQDIRLIDIGFLDNWKGFDI